jgi:hypothetical protein
VFQQILSQSVPEANRFYLLPVSPYPLVLDGDLFRHPSLYSPEEFDELEQADDLENAQDL